MRKLVDGLRIGVARVMANAESEVAKRESFALADESEDHSELAVGSWQIDLEAGWELRAVASFGIAAAQRLDLDTVLLELAASSAQRLRPSPATPHRVLGEGALVEENAGMTPPDGQGLPLAVCGLERAVLCLESGDLLLGGIALVLAEHCPPRGVAGDHELIGAALLGDDELTLERAADLDVRGLLHCQKSWQTGRRGN